MATYKKRPGTDTDHGHKFERDILRLTYLRCLNLYKMNKLKSFKISNNMDQVGAFDDIVCRIEYEENGSLKTKLILIQTKHKENPLKNAFSDETLMPPLKKKKNEKPPPLHAYIKSFLRIRQILNDTDNVNSSENKASGDEIKENEQSLRQAFDCKLEDAQFVYYSNATTTDLQHFLKVENSDVVKNILESNPRNEIYKLKLDYEGLVCIYPDLYKDLNPNEVAGVTQFLNNFTVYINQESEQSLESLIKKEIESSLSDRNVDVNLLYKTLCEEMKHISDSNDIPFITEQDNFVENLFSLIRLQSQTATVKEKYNPWLQLFSAETLEEMYNDVFNHQYINILYKLAEKSIIIIKYLQLAAKMKETSNNFLILYVTKDYFEMWRKVRNLQSYTNYSEVIVCLDNVPLADIDHMCSTQLRTRELILTLIEHDSVVSPSIWKELSSTGLEQILNYNVTFQGYSVALRQVFSYSDNQETFWSIEIQNVVESLLPLMVQNKDILIGKSLPDMENIYIERRYKKNTTFLKLEAIKEKYDDFILFPKCNVSETLKVYNCTNVIVLESEEDARNVFFSSLESNKNAHFCYVDTYLEVLFSKGTLVNLIKYKVDQEDLKEECSEYESDEDDTIDNITECESDEYAINEKSTECGNDDNIMNEGTSEYGSYEHIVYEGTSEHESVADSMSDKNLDRKNERHIFNEEAFLQHTLNNKCTVISDYVGMGKSTALRKISQCIKENCKDYWVEYIKLSMQEKNLKLLQENANPVDTVQRLLNLNDLDKFVFQHKCNNDGKVALLFDGFDEISLDSSRTHFLHLFKALYNTKIKTIFLSTRPNVKAAQGIPTFHFNILGFNYQDMHSYLLKYWSQHFNQKYAEKIKNIVPDIVKQAKTMKTILRDIIAVPLQTNMLAETYNKKLEQILSSEESFRSFQIPALSLYSLYSNFIDMHIDRCMTEKFDITDQNISNYELLKKLVFKQNSGIWEAIACQEIFPSTQICEVKESDIEELVKQKIGIFVITDHKTITFVHRSFAEFLAAKYVARLLFETRNTEYLNFIYQNICVGKTFVVLRKFMNAIYENEQHWENAEINFVPDIIVEDDVLFFAIKEGNAFLFKAILQHLSRNQDVLKRKLNVKYQVDSEIIWNRNLLHFSAIYCEQVFDDIINSEFFHCITDIDGRHFTALHLACKYGRVNAVKSYLSKVKNESLFEIMNQTDENMFTPLMLAAEEGHTSIIKILYDLGASIHCKSNSGWNALLYASKSDHIETVKYLVEQGAHINEKENNGETALIIASCWGHTAIVKYLVEKGADINITNANGCTALMMASFSGNIDVVKFLVEQGDDINKTDHRGRTTLICACEYSELDEENIEVIRYFFEQARANINIQDCKRRTALMYLARNDTNIDITKAMTQNGADINIVDARGRTAVMIAALYGQKDTVKYFSELSVDIVNKFDDNGDTCLTLSAGAENTSVLQYIIDEHKPNLDYQNNDGETALFRAAFLGRIETVKLLIIHGASVNVCNTEGNSAFTALIEKNDKLENCSGLKRSWKQYPAILNCLIRNGTDVNHQNNSGNSALHVMLCSNSPYISEYYSVICIKKLFERGADINLKNTTGETPAMIAQRHENPEIKSYFDDLINTVNE